jgi:hypothetical protein
MRTNGEHRRKDGANLLGSDRGSRVGRSRENRLRRVLAYCAAFPSILVAAGPEPTGKGARSQRSRALSRLRCARSRRGVDKVGEVSRLNSLGIAKQDEPMQTQRGLGLDRLRLPGAISSSYSIFLLTNSFRLRRFPPVVARGASFRQPRRQCPPEASEAKSGKASQSKKAATTSIRPYADLSADGGRCSCRCGPDGGSSIWRNAMTEKVKPDPEDYAQIAREYGPLPYHATIKEQAERYRLAQVAKLIRLYGPGKLPPESAPRK